MENPYITKMTYRVTVKQGMSTHDAGKTGDP